MGYHAECGRNRSNGMSICRESQKLTAPGALPLGRGIVDPEKSPLLYYLLFLFIYVFAHKSTIIVILVWWLCGIWSLYVRKCIRANVGSPEVERVGARPPWTWGDVVDPLKHAPNLYWVSMPNIIAVGQTVPPEKLAPHALPFNVTQSYRNWQTQRQTDRQTEMPLSISRARYTDARKKIRWKSELIRMGLGVLTAENM